ncbi:hypothetical protein [Ruminococcus sp. HUN007]|uniref:hypothetical protein n=1 Tax=Ruminococcus sp. HUN007 TaxID=1514668 RepID=UPI0005D2A14F|nr:hypothetical protein [Ruminococcus sp. HUN007]
MTDFISDFDEWVRRMHSNEEMHYLRDHVYFLLGTYCKVDKVDSYLVKFNNDTGEVNMQAADDNAVCDAKI